jgi:hypothetical protein
MQMTQALRELVRAQTRDQEFPYMDFVGAFLLMERWIRHTGGRSLQLLDEAQPDDLLGLPLGTAADDIKLGYVLSLLRTHGLEVLEGVTREAVREQAPLYH